MIREEQPIYCSHGTFRGQLTELTCQYGEPGRFTLRPAAGPSYVTVTLTPSVILDSRGLLGGWVEVFGVLKFRGDEPHPFEIEAETITVLPDTENLPRAAEIAGSMPDLTGGLDVVEYLRRLREEDA